jgi:anti-sigma factor RsiW
VTCNDAQQLIHGYVDRELDLVHNLEIEHHLRECPGCARTYDNLQTLRGGLAAEGMRFQAPAALRQRIQSALESPRKRRQIRPILSWKWAAVAASLALAALLTWGTVRILSLPSAEDLLVNEIVASHQRSLLLKTHIFDVKSSNRHTVKPWFDGKVDFSFNVGDWPEQDFPLKGGRLDYFHGRRVAVLVYHRRLHVINLFIWKAGEVLDAGPRFLERDGYNLVHWARGGLAYWAVSNLNARELGQFVKLAEQESAFPPPP